MKKLILIIAIFFLSCGLARSPLVNTDIPIVCKLDLECRYYQEHTDKSGCIEYTKTCERMLRYTLCRNEPAEEKRYCKDFMNTR